MLSYGITAVAYADGQADDDFDPPAGHRGAVPVGLAFVESIVHALILHEWEVPYRWVIPDGHGFEVQGGGRRFDATLVCTDDELGAWDFVVEPRRGFFPWQRKPGGEAMVRLGARLEEILRQDPRVQGLELDD